MTARHRGVLVLDFDGVLCDSIEECTLVAHIAHEGLPARAFVAPGLAGVPPDVVERFRRCRPFMRHLGHFLVALVETRPPRDHAAFSARYERIPAAQTQTFVDTATAIRAEVRRDHFEQWLARHRIVPALAALAEGAYIATARDASSVRQILGAHGLILDDARTFHSVRDKTQALASIASLESVRASDVRLVDDNIENCLAARAAGFGTAWAAWGYHAPGDAEIAREQGIQSLTIDDLSAARGERHSSGLGASPAPCCLRTCEATEYLGTVHNYTDLVAS